MGQNVSCKKISSPEKAMKNQRMYRQLASRLAETVELEGAWKKMTAIYGKKVADKVRKLVPADPTFLYDLAISSYIEDGMSMAEATNKVISYSPDDWNNDFDGFKSTITGGLEYCREQYWSKQK